MGGMAGVEREGGEEGSLSHGFRDLFPVAAGTVPQKDDRLADQCGDLC